MVRRKLYLRRLAAQEAARMHPKAGASSGGHHGSGHAGAHRAGGGAAAACPSLQLGQPGQLEGLVDQCLDNMVVPLAGNYL